MAVFYSYDILENTKLKGKSLDQWLPSSRDKEMGWLSSHQREFFRAKETALYLDYEAVYTNLDMC